MRKGKMLMKTLADLKRDAKSGKIRLELIERFGKTGDEIPERLRGIREVAGVNTVAINLRNASGEESELRFGRASLIEYRGDMLTVYNSGYRPLTEEERAIVAGEEAFREEFQRNNPYSEPYWAIKKYYKDSSCPWMAGFETVRGKHYQRGEDRVRDDAVRGEVVLRYRVHAA